MPPQPEKWLDIRLFSGRLGANAQGDLQVPPATVTLKPGKGRVWVEGVETRAVIAGDVPPESAHLAQQALRDVYRWPGTHPSKALDEGGSVELGAPSVALGPLAGPVSVQLSVTIHFKPNRFFQSVSGEHSESAQASWMLSPDELSGRGGRREQPPCRMVLNPALVLLRDRDEPAVLQAAIYHRPDREVPTLELRQQPDQHPTLVAELQELIKTPFAGPTALADGAEVWTVQLALKLSGRAGAELKSLAATEPLSLQGHVTIGTARADFTLRLQPRQGEHHGFLAIDLGTSSSTVTLFDESVVADERGVPGEQATRLRRLVLSRLVDEQGNCRLKGIEQAWDELANSLSLPGEGPAKLRLINCIQSDGTRMMEALRRLELGLYGTAIEDRVCAVLEEAYEESVLEPRFNSQNLIWIELQPPRAQEERPPGFERKDIVSELEIVDVLATPEGKTRLKVQLGDEARENRLKAMAAVGTGPKALSLADISFKFRISPKRLLGKEETFAGELQAKPVAVTGHQIVQATWMKLIELTDDWRRRHPGRVSQGRFSRVIVTYPTVAPPAVRREAERLVRDLDFEEVIIDYDEAVSAALFYFHRELGGSLDLGPEYFKSCARYDGPNRYSQNALVLDIGGGSTDLALIKFTMKEEDPPDRSLRGGGGRYYVVTPRLLGSSGNRHLGGDLITLRVFELLKAALADRLLTAVHQSELQDEDGYEGQVSALLDLIQNVPPTFKDADRFKANSLLDPVSEFREGHERRRHALSVAEEVLPTRWVNKASNSQGFSALWRLAEDAKVNHFARGCSFQIGPEEIQKLLPAFGLRLKLQKTVRVEVSLAQFEQAAREIIQQAVQIAAGLLSDRLPTDEQTQEQEGLDWLILSGKTCNLKLVRNVLEHEFARRAIHWNRDRVTFVPEYAKLATSAGACYAEKIRRKGFDTRNAQELLKKGLNQLRIIINNLFWYLPCAFQLSTQDQYGLPLFEAATPLMQLDNTDLGKARSRPLGAQLLMTVLRIDYAGAKAIPWYSFGGEEHAKAVGMSPTAFQERVKVQFEVDHRLLMKIFLWEDRNSELPHHYQIDPAASALTVPCPGTDGARGEAWCDVGVAVSATQLANGGPEVLIRAGQPFRESFHLDQEQVEGLVVELPDLFKDGKLRFHRRLPGETDWRLIEGELEQPDRNVGSQFPVKYQLTFDARGNLRVHRGCVPYWSVSTPEEWKKDFTRVLELDLALVVAPTPTSRDPFNGDH